MESVKNVFQKAKRWVTNKFVSLKAKVKGYFNKHPELPEKIGEGLGMAIMAYIIKKLKDIKNRRETERRVYDPSEGHYNYTKKRMTEKDWRAIRHYRERYGGTISEALHELGYL